MKKTQNTLLIRYRNLKGWVLSSQVVVAVLLTMVYPIVFSLILSFTDLKLSLGNIKFIGWSNYIWIFGRDSGFFQALLVSMGFSAVSTLLQTVLGFLIAVMLYFMSGKLQSFFKTAIYLPVVLPSAVVSAMWIMMYAGDEFGLLNIIFGLTNPPFQWLGTVSRSFIAVVTANTWRYLGITMVIYFVNMNAVSKDVIDGAKVDGANKFVIMMRIIFPLTWSATTMNIIMSMIGGIKSFDLFYLFQTNANLTYELTPVSVLIFRAGLGNAQVANIRLALSVTMSLTLAFILMIITLATNKLMSKKGDE
ncbi:MAG: sugar ABC transporter permease [Clostridiales bacterium]|jgi:ABC-type sugar transport system permease subunit|nr:sugar ABC transporter permease [Clostridiales bacterium]